MITRARADVASMLTLLFVFGACVMPPLEPMGATRTTAQLEPDERALWKQSRELQYKIEVGGLLFEDEALDVYLARIVERSTPDVVRAAGIEPRIEVVSDVNIDGYSFANGVIYIHTGLLAKMRDETQLATLVTRELAHVVHRHALRAKRDARLNADTLAWIGIGASMVQGGDQLKLLAQAASITSAVGFAHALEVRADERGLEFLDAAGYAVSETPDFYRMTLEHLAEVHAQGVWGWWPFTPPPQVTARIGGMETLLQSTWTGHAARSGPTLEAVAFRRTIHPVVLRQAELELAAGLFVTAEATARAATDARARDARAWVLLGRALQGQRAKPLPNRASPDVGAVRDAFREALRLEPRNVDATRELAMTHYRKTAGGRAPGDAREALRRFRAYQRLAPSAQDREYIEAYIDELEDEVR